MTRISTAVLLVLRLSFFTFLLQPRCFWVFLFYIFHPKDERKSRRELSRQWMKRLCVNSEFLFFFLRRCFVFSTRKSKRNHRLGTRPSFAVSVCVPVCLTEGLSVCPSVYLFADYWCTLISLSTISSCLLSLEVMTTSIFTTHIRIVSKSFFSCSRR